MDQFPERRNSNRLSQFDYSSNEAYFITICSDDRANLFGIIENETVILNNFGKIAKSWWQKLPERFPDISLDSYIVMPDHFHGIVWVETERAIRVDLRSSVRTPPLRSRRSMTISKAIGYFKMNSAKEINRVRNLPGQSVWQRSFFDHVIRNDHDLNEIRDYIMTNPLRWAMKHGTDGTGGHAGLPLRIVTISLYTIKHDCTKDD